MTASPYDHASLMARGLVVALSGLVCLGLSSEAAYGNSADLSRDITNLQAQIVQLNNEIETLKAEAASVERKWNKISSEHFPSFHTDAAAIQLSRITTAWSNRQSASGSGNDGVAPIVTFDLKNVGTAPITDINLLVSFYKPDKEVIGGGMIGLLDSTNAPLRTGMWQKVTIDSHSLQFPVTRSIIPLNADLYVETAPGSYVLIDTYNISPGLQP